MIRHTHHYVVVKQGQEGSLPCSQQQVTSTPHKPPTTQNHVKELKKLVAVGTIENLNLFVHRHISLLLTSSQIKV